MRLDENEKRLIFLVDLYFYIYGIRLYYSVVWRSYLTLNLLDYFNYVKHCRYSIKFYYLIFTRIPPLPIFWMFVE